MIGRLVREISPPVGTCLDMFIMYPTYVQTMRGSSIVNRITAITEYFTIVTERNILRGNCVPIVIFCDRSVVLLHRNA